MFNRGSIDIKDVERDLKKISKVVDGIGVYALANGEGFLKGDGDG